MEGALWLIGCLTPPRALSTDIKITPTCSERAGEKQRGRRLGPAGGGGGFREVNKQGAATVSYPPSLALTPRFKSWRGSAAGGGRLREKCRLHGEDGTACSPLITPPTLLPKSTVWIKLSCESSRLNLLPCTAAQAQGPRILPIWLHPTSVPHLHKWQILAPIGAKVVNGIMTLFSRFWILKCSPRCASHPGVQYIIQMEYFQW